MEIKSYNLLCLLCKKRWKIAWQNDIAYLYPYLKFWLVYSSALLTLRYRNSTGYGRPNYSNFLLSSAWQSRCVCWYYAGFQFKLLQYCLSYLVVYRYFGCSLSGKCKRASPAALSFESLSVIRMFYVSKFFFDKYLKLLWWQFIFSLPQKISLVSKLLYLSRFFPVRNRICPTGGLHNQPLEVVKWWFGWQLLISLHH